MKYYKDYTLLESFGLLYFSGGYQTEESSTTGVFQLDVCRPVTIDYDWFGSRLMFL